MRNASSLSPVSSPIPVMHRARLPGATVLLALSGAGVQALDCEAFLRMHGLLRRAANKCSFTQYNPEIVERAKQCYEELGASTAAPLMLKGADDFNLKAEVRGEVAFCADLAKRFPMVVRD